MNLDISKYIVPVLGIACVGGVVLVVSGMRPPVAADAADSAGTIEARVPKNLVLGTQVPTMEEVVAKHLFVPERIATGENAFPDLVVKGVYVGETERNAVFSLKSKPDANLRVWQGDEEAALAQVMDERDPRQPIVDFLGEWNIKSIDFAGVTFEHLFTGEVETYAVDYKPLKHAKASAEAGYGQGYFVDAVAGGAKAASGRAATGQASAAQSRAASGGTQAIAGRVGQYMQTLSPQQRQQFLQQLQKQEAASGKKSNASQQNNSSNKKSSDNQRSGGNSRTSSGNRR
jgi:hypothetical protein